MGAWINSENTLMITYRRKKKIILWKTGGETLEWKSMSWGFIKILWRGGLGFFWGGGGGIPVICFWMNNQLLRSTNDNFAKPS